MYVLCCVLSPCYAIFFWWSSFIDQFKQVKIKFFFKYGQICQQGKMVKHVKNVKGPLMSTNFRQAIKSKISKYLQNSKNIMGKNIKAVKKEKEKM